MTAVGAFFDAARALKRELAGEGLTQAEVDTFNAIIAGWTPVTVAPTARPVTGASLTAKVALETVSHEAIVLEAYKDSVGVWTWSVGITNASGHEVHPRYLNNPQTLARALEVFVWLLQTRYMPAVIRAFDGFSLTEAQVAAALSFHYNTGAILRADWVAQWKRGDIAQAKASIMNWRSPPEIVERREKERDLFFDGRWSSDGTALLIPVKKPSYRPDFANARRVNVRAAIEGLLA